MTAAGETAFKAWRRRLNLTQEAAADLLGISVSQVRVYDRGLHYGARANQPAEPTAAELARMRELEAERGREVPPELAAMEGLQGLLETARAAGLGEDQLRAVEEAQLELLRGRIARRVMDVAARANGPELARLDRSLRIVEDAVNAREGAALEAARKKAEAGTDPDACPPLRSVLSPAASTPGGKNIRAGGKNITASGGRGDLSPRSPS